MPHLEKIRRRGGLKQNLALPGESNRQNVQGGVGQVQDQAKPIVSGKALEQPQVKPTGGIKRAVGRVGRSIREVGLQPGAIATNLLTKETGGDRIASPARTEADIQGGIKKRIERGVAVPTFDKKGKLIGTERKIGTSILTQKDGVDILRGTKPPATEQIDFTRGTPIEVRGAKARRARALARTGRGAPRGKQGIDIFASAGRLAESLASPEAQAERKLARGAAVRRKGRRADIKLANERIKVLSSTLANIPELEENEEIRSKITTQITDLISKGTSDDSVLNEATRFKKAGFSDEETTSILQRLGVG